MSNFGPYSISQRSVTPMPAGRLGKIADLGETQTVALPHNIGRALNTITLQFATVASNAVYTYRLSDALYLNETFTFTSDGTATVAEAASDAAAAFNAQPVLAGAGSAVAATDTVTITLRPTVQAQLSVVAQGAPGNSVITVVSNLNEGADYPLAVATYMSADGVYATTVKPAGDIEDVLVGCTVLGLDQEMSYPYVPGPIPAARAGERVEVLRSGAVYVAGGSDAQRGQVVLVGTAAGEIGQWFNAAGTGRLPIPKPFAQWLNPNIIELALGR